MRERDERFEKLAMRTVESLTLSRFMTIVDNQVVIVQGSLNNRYTFNFNAHSFIPQRRILINGLMGAIEGDLISGQIKLLTMSGVNDVDVNMRGVVKDTDIRADGDSNLVSALLFKMLESVDGSRRNAALNDDTGTSINFLWSFFLVSFVYLFIHLSIHLFTHPSMKLCLVEMESIIQ